MAIVRIMLLIGACLIYGVAADDGDDFSNNLFTDLGPLLTLFGERVTMQFMSQSMGWADNVVLAMAPLGILTAVVGAIRVGGPSWLKAIIGRARESRAISEAELMSSTSHEVCELWNGHEIVRVMGKGPIREFVVLEPPAAAADNDDDNNNKGRRSGSGKGGGGREMMKVVQEKEDHGKYLVDDKFTTQSDDPENGNGNGDCSTIIMRNTDVCTPNLTLNVHGHVNRWELYVVAIVGTILQLGVIVYFGFASVTFLHDGSPVAQYALPSTVLGTLLLVVGIMICSYVVKSSTGETRYRPLSGREARVVWLQKSGTVNDQSFDSFAVFPTVPLEVITTSERLPVRFPKSQGGWLEGLVHRSLVIFGAKTRAEAVTVIGSVVSICGYVVQFVGLRGAQYHEDKARAWQTCGLARPCLHGSHQPGEGH
ncbi:hypothetical protein GGR53DRAFT_868 [Hypoxylon sp. FL1150]|nr:hypothetical protein GGR53DRAFT_868 [Hypoxylon sp. FL1150]